MNLTSFINPGIAVDMIKKQIKKQLNKEIENFEIFYLAEKDKMYFIIEIEPGKKENFLFPNDTIKALIEIQAKTSLKKNQQLTAVRMEVNKDNNIVAYIYLIENGEKLVLKNKIN
ncbi:MAG: hypothetical protein WC389_05435 [Lutibacter sp.]|jgi:hypothetical protein